MYMYNDVVLELCVNQAKVAVQVQVPGMYMYNNVVLKYVYTRQRLLYRQGSWYVYVH